LFAEIMCISVLELRLFKTQFRYLLQIV